MVSLPVYADLDTQIDILNRMLAQYPNLNQVEGGVLYTLLSTIALELARSSQAASTVLQYGFVATATGPYLDLHGQMAGVPRFQPTKATGFVTFTGTDGTTITSGTIITTQTSGNSIPWYFLTDVDATISGGTATVGVTAMTEGSAGNVAPGAISFATTLLTGVTAISNADATSGGSDLEGDTPYRARILAELQASPDGGNKGSYIKWALSVPNVGGVAVLPIKYGVGTVSVAIIGSDKEPADQALVDAVQEYIAPRLDYQELATAMTKGGAGVAGVTNDTGETPNSVQMIYEVAGVGWIHHSDFEDVLLDSLGNPAPGIWTARVMVKVDSLTGAANLLTIAVYNTTATAVAGTTPTGGSATATYHASQLSLGYTEIVQQFYWNGTDELELQIQREVADTARTVHIQSADYVSMFSDAAGNGKAPIGAVVTVEPATPVNLTVAITTLSILDGHVLSDVETAITAVLNDYIATLAFGPDPWVRYVRVASVILGVVGVYDYASMTINTGTANISVPFQSVAVIAAVNFS